MSVCSHNHRIEQSLFGRPCQNEAEPGKTLCAFHLARARKNSRVQQEKKTRERSTRPAWMKDPSLLPKRPPGAA